MGIEHKLEQTLDMPRKVRFSSEQRKWTAKAIKILIARYRKLKGRAAILEAERVLFDSLEAACRREGPSGEVLQLLTVIDTYRHKSLNTDPLRIGPTERKELVQKALKLKAQGRYLWQIAEDFGVDSRTLETWLRHAKTGEDKYQKGSAVRTKLPEL